MRLVDSHGKQEDELRGFAQLHVDLVKAEVRDGSHQVHRSLVLTGLAWSAASIGMFALALALFLWLQAHFSNVVAGLITGLVFFACSSLAFWFSRKLLSGAIALTLPKTREMLGEITRWDENQPNS